LVCYFINIFSITKITRKYKMQLSNFGYDIKTAGHVVMAHGLPIGMLKLM